MLISIVVPCYNEEGVIAETHRRLLQVLNAQSGIESEILYIDDGSRDQTWPILQTLPSSERVTIRALTLSRNFGHQLAVSAGIERAKGDAVVLIDADLQDPPEVLPEMIREWQSGYEVVYGVRTERDGESAFKRITAAMFYRLINRLSEVPIPVDTGDFRLMDRKVVDALMAMPEHDRFIRGMVSWLGFRQKALPYKRDARWAGETKYPLSKMIKFALTAISSFSTSPLKIASWVGFAASGAAVLGMLYVLGLRMFTSTWVEGWTALMLAVLFIGGIQLLVLGIMGEYIGRIYGEAKRRPLFLIREERVQNALGVAAVDELAE
jgi:dolichol-phosphate mannosyltransferase